MAKTELFSWRAFDDAVEILTNKLKRHNVLSGAKSIYGVPRGGLVLAVALSHRLGLPITLDLADLLSVGIRDGGVLVVDDISDTGRTLKLLKPMAVCTATIHYVVTSVCMPDFWAFERAVDSWIVYPWEAIDERRLGKT